MQPLGNAPPSAPGPSVLLALLSPLVDMADVDDVLAAPMIPYEGLH